jgi:hypothetical protein
MSESIAKRWGGMGGQAHVPSFFYTSILIFISMEKEFCRAIHGGLY